MNFVVPVRVGELHFQFPLLHKGMVRALYWAFPTQVPKPLYHAPPRCHCGQRHDVRYSTFRSISSMMGKSLS